MIFKHLQDSDKPQLDRLIAATEESLSDKSFWLPISEISRNHFFDESWTCFFGAFEKDVLIAAVGLFLNPNEYGESQEILGIKTKKLAELGRAMTLPEYRGKKIMTQLANCLIQHAATLDLDALVATSHPQNQPSQKFLRNAGFVKRGHTVKQNNFERDILIKEL